MGKPKPPVSLLWDKYSFDPLTGRFHSLHGSLRACGRMKKPDDVIHGNIVGNHDGKKGSHQLSINKDHRCPYAVCVWTWIHGKWPEDAIQYRRKQPKDAIQMDLSHLLAIQVDHIDFNPFNHRPWNLRLLPGYANIERNKGRKHGR
jgi:hypothetical protein